jgi:hypothetical protein
MLYLCVVIPISLYMTLYYFPTSTQDLFKKENDYDEKHTGSMLEYYIRMEFENELEAQIKATKTTRMYFVSGPKRKS